MLVTNILEKWFPHSYVDILDVEGGVDVRHHFIIVFGSYYIYHFFVYKVVEAIYMLFDESFKS